MFLVSYNFDYHFQIFVFSSEFKANLFCSLLKESVPEAEVCVKSDQEVLNDWKKYFNS